MANTTYYTDSQSSDESFEWSSDSAPRTKRKTTRKTKATRKNLDGGSVNKKPKKPGRKPMLESSNELPSDPKLKRKAQNRAAQRAFRERKEQFVNELQTQIRELEVAKAKREKELSRENARLKKENERLKEENYLLKDAKFTFEYPQRSKKEEEEEKDSALDEHPLTATMVSPPISDEQMSTSQEDAQSYVSDISSSPLTEATSSVSLLSDDCACSTNAHHSCDDLSESMSSPMFDSGSSATDGNHGFGSSPPKSTPDFTFDNAITTTNSQTIPDLFRTKEINGNPFLTDYHQQQTPFLNTTSMVDSFLPPQDPPFSALFGTDDLFGTSSPAPFTTTDLDPLFSEQMQAFIERDAFFKCAPENEKPCKRKVLSYLRRAKGANRRAYQVNQDVKSYCPSLDLDQLCDDLKKKISFDSNRILTDEDVDLYIQCIQRKA
ncbi:MAG: hypothetical protein EXX96DRAFT_569270 [Benjaminiella poitrasii]|nr:MAG: hypothetical protein EXX96DRAFT_569270 [Benjaminiella poitrasii]